MKGLDLKSGQYDLEGYPRIVSLTKVREALSPGQNRIDTIARFQGERSKEILGNCNIPIELVDRLSHVDIVKLVNLLADIISPKIPYIKFRGKDGYIYPLLGGSYKRGETNFLYNHMILESTELFFDEATYSAFIRLGNQKIQG